MKKYSLLLIFLILTTLEVLACTIGIASNTITASNKPILWKSRDISPNTINTLRYVDNLTYRFVGVASPNENRMWMGVNEMGFALANSLSNDLTVDVGEFNNGNLIYNSLGLVSNLDEFENYLDFLTTNSTIDLELRGNFVAFDAQGNTKLYEVNNNSYWIFETDEVFNPYLLRTNHSVNGGGIDGIERLVRSTDIIQDLANNNQLSVQNIISKQIRDVSDHQSQPLDLPWAIGDPSPLYNTYYSICRRNTISAVVIEGVQAGEDPKLTTLWLLMGNPFVTHAIPIFPTLRPNLPVINNLSENSPELVNILWNEDNMFLLDTSKFVNDNFSLLPTLEDKETELYETIEQMKNEWINQEIDANNLTSFINQEASSALTFSSELFINFTPNDNYEVLPITRLTSYPNPFQKQVTIEFRSNNNNGLVNIYNLKGQLVKTITQTKQKSVLWDGRDSNNKNMPNGIYLIKYKNASETAIGKVLLMK
ncbi:T9SS type A sorting domain-containing protein [bacterium]|nr:T9SS type A sorting domain-containing protein [bacterium]